MPDFICRTQWCEGTGCQTSYSINKKKLGKIIRMYSLVQNSLIVIPQQNKNKHQPPTLWSLSWDHSHSILRIRNWYNDLASILP